MEKVDWIKLVSRRHSLFRLDFLDRGTAIKVKEKWGLNYDDQMFISSPKINAWFCSKEKIDKLGNLILDKVNHEKGFVNKIALATEKSCFNLVKITKEISTGNLGKLTDQQLALRLKKYSEAHYDFCIYFDVSNSIKEIGTQRISDGLRGKMLLLKPSKIPLTNQEQIDLRKIAINNENALKKHMKKYEWLSVYNPDEPSLPLSYFQDRIKDLAKTKPKEKQAEKLIIPKELQNLIKLMKRYVYLHTFRAEMLSKSYFLLKPFLTEIAGRWKIDLTALCALTSEEIIKILEKNGLPDFEEIEKRKKAYLHLMKDGKINIYSGKEAEEMFLKEISKDEKEQKSEMLKGFVASQGLAEGKVRVIINKEDLKLIEKGDILVTTMTSPDYVQAIHKSGAVVTDEGGLLCHAAIICREMGTPCVMGTKIATLVLKTGDWVKVDAFDGIIVKIIKKEQK